tara:strand:- start:828 stop:1118 length:291 start_codon:yes stop_codon:yes gene_type:complete
MSNLKDWKSELAKVRAFVKKDVEPVVEKTQDEIIAEEIDALLDGFDEPIVETQESDVNTDKLIEKNMLGRLAKSLDLNEDKKEMLFNYFEKGELIQ